MDGKDSESPGPRQKDKSLPGHDIFCTPENSNFLSATPYKTLDPTKREIRLLKVLPDSGSGFVECELLPSTPIAEVRGKYLALSYCAGDPRNTEIILVNDVKCNAFANLCHALTCARHFWTTQPGDQDFLLWADQICINQADLSERSHQVGFMRDIYQSAQQTLICLSTSSTQGEGMKWFIDRFDGDGKQPSFKKSGSKPVYSANSLTAFWEEVMESPWWTRAWVFQEFVVSAQATFLSGRHHLSWVRTRRALRRYLGVDEDNSMVHWLESIFQTRNSTTHYAGDVENAAKIVRSMLKTKVEWESNASLPFLLHRSRNLKASDERDRIYAVLGLANPGYVISPDYSASNTLSHVLVETTKSIILFENDLSILSAVNANRSDRMPGLPSWVVDWTYEETDEKLSRSREIRHLQATLATPRRGQEIATFRKAVDPETLQESSVMEVRGRFIGVIHLSELNFPRLDVREELGTFAEFIENTLEVWDIGIVGLRAILKRTRYGHKLDKFFGDRGYPTDATMSETVTIF